MPDRIVLDRSARERVFLTIAGEPPFQAGASVQVQLLGTSTWYPATVTQTGDPIRAEIFFAGPLAVAQSGDVPVTVSGLFRVRVNDAGEIIPRGGGYVALAD